MKFIQIGHILRPQSPTTMDKMGQVIGGSITNLHEETYEDYLNDQKQEIQIDNLKYEFMKEVQKANKDLCRKWMAEWAGDPGELYPLESYLKGQGRPVYMPKPEKKFLGFTYQEPTFTLEVPPICGSKSVDLIVPEGIILYDQNYWHHCTIFTWLKGKPFLAGWK